MAASNVMGVNYTKATSSPPVIMKASEWGGKVRCQIDKVTVNAIEAGSTIKIGRLPKGARLLPTSVVIFPAMGSGVTAKVGTPASDAAFKAATSVASAVTLPLDDPVGRALEPTDETDVLITTAGATTTASDLTIWSYLFYTVE